METQTTQSQKKRGTEVAGEAKIRQLMNDFLESVKDQDVDAIMAAYTPDVVAYDMMDSLVKGKKELQRSWEQCFENSKKFDLEIRDLKINADTDVAFANCLSHATGTTKNGEEIDLWIRWSGGYRRIGDQWLVVHEHTSIPVDFQNEKLLTDLKPEKSLRH